MDIADVFNNGASQIPTGLPFQAYPAAAIARKGKIEEGGEWRQIQGNKENMNIVAYEHKNDSGTTYVQFMEEVKDLSQWEKSVESLWKHANDTSDLDSDVYLAMLVQLHNGPKDQDGKTWISAQQILKYRGVEPKKEKGKEGSRGYRWEDIEAVGACITRMEKVFIKISDMEVLDDSSQGKRKGKQRINYMSRLFVFSDVITHETLPLDGPSESIPIAWQYQESTWMLPFLHGANRFTGLLIQKVLNYDPYHQQWEKRLAKYFLFWLRTNAKYGENKRPIKVSELVEKLNLTIDERNPQRTKNRFEEAMNILQKDELLAWKYAEGNENLPARKWLATWLNQKIKVDDSPQIKNQYATIATHAKIVREQKHLYSTKKRKEVKS